MDGTTLKSDGWQKLFKRTEDDYWYQHFQERLKKP